MMETPPLVLALLHWLCGVLITATLLTTSFDIKYDTKEYLNLVVPVTTLSTSLLYEWRDLNPIMYGFLSCVLPWTCLFFNEDIQKKLPRMLMCRRRGLVKRMIPNLMPLQNSSVLLASRASAW
ncbi:hypothetical protein ANCCAN_28398 [Ancylostoma caninum]|uniref:Uncharacterized protein n=1 Tax=Ancylostoma caninum TaxID=29170 RepID=A0A368F1B5_ANCCA|nr:hypothetical protein ANCCAN_28398 [Ancylostoma caninum]